VRRFASAIAFLVLLVAVLAAAACGQRFDRAGDAPAAGDLAADALAALEAAGSAHFVADMRTTTPTFGDPLEFRVHVEGDASATVVDADASVSFGAGALRGHVLVREHDLFVQFMGRWYGERGEGIAEAVAEAKKEHGGAVWTDFATPAGLRRTFGEIFVGEVDEGPVLDGAATWRFDGRLDPKGIAAYVRRYDVRPSDRDEQMLAEVAEASHLVLIVGRADHLPRRIEFSVELSAEQLKEMEQDDSGPFSGAANVETTVGLSEFGKPVESDPPANFQPLEALFAELFSGFE
jgi:hypothetical protein